MQRAILDGIRVLDLSEGLAGSVASLILAESGCDVVKVEPLHGACLRGSPPFAVWNRSKRSIALDRTGKDRSLFERLVSAADVLVHDLAPAEARAQRLDNDSLKALAPGIIAASIPGFPAGHQDEDVPAHDTLVLAASGIMDEQAPIGRDAGPVYLRFPLGSWLAAWLAAIGVATRILHKRQGKNAGTAVSTSILQGALVPVQMLWRQVERPSPSLAYGMPKDRTDATLLECSDGVWLHFIGDVLKSPLVVETMESIPAAERAAANAATPSSYWPDFGWCKAAFRRRPSAEWLADLWANDIAVQPALPMGALYSDEQCLANGYVVEVADHEAGLIRQPGMPFVTTPPPRQPAPAPRLDENREAILAEWSARGRQPAPAQISGPDHPLAGLRVLDFGSYLAGPLAPMLMGDLGADVIKLESLGGDAMRDKAEWSVFGCQRSKRSLALDLKHPDARRIVERLVANADVVHHNQRMPAARKLGIDYDSLRAINPRLIYCHVSSYGPVGPRKDWPGYDQLFQSSAGWEYEGAGKGNKPMWHRFGMMDHQAAVSSLYGIMLALIERERTGEGQFVASSLLGASLLTCSETYLCADGRLAPYPQLDALQMGVGPGNRIYQASDGWLAILADEAALASLAARLGIADPAQIEQRFAAMTAEAAMAEAREAGAHAAPVRLGQQDAFLDNATNQALGLAIDQQHPLYGKVRQVGGYWQFEGQSLALERPVPMIGQHSSEILAEAGFERGEIDRLLATRAVLQA